MPRSKEFHFVGRMCGLLASTSVVGSKAAALAAPIVEPIFAKSVVDRLLQSRYRAPAS